MDKYTLKIAKIIKKYCHNRIKVRHCLENWNCHPRRVYTRPLLYESFANYLHVRGNNEIVDQREKGDVSGSLPQKKSRPISRGDDSAFHPKKKKEIIIFEIMHLCMIDVDVQKCENGC